MKILHCADWHVRDKDIDEVSRCLAAIEIAARNEAVDLVVIAGDIFDSRDIKAESKSALLTIGFISCLANICPVAIVTGTASHDGEAPKILSYAKGVYPILVADKPQQIYLYDGEFREGADSPDCILSFVPQPTKQYWQSEAGISGTDQEIGQAMSGLFAGFGAQAAAYPGVPHILVYHGGISGARLPSGQIRTGMDIEVSTDQFMLADPDLVCCGHIHQCQQLSSTVFYSGPIYSTKVDEQEAGFYIHEIDESNFFSRDSRYIETPHKRTVRLSFDQTAGQAITVPMEGITGQTVRMEIKAWQDEASAINKDELAENLRRWGAADVDIRIIRVPRENIRAEAVLKAEELPDKVKAMAESRGETVSEGIIEKAGALENLPTDLLLKEVAA